MWEPLPLIVYGYAVHPLTPSRRDTRLSNRSRGDRLSIVTESSGDEHYINRDVVSLEVGDEIYAFEKYTPRSREVDGVWFRGYVVCTTRRPQVTWSVAGDLTDAKSPPKIEEPQQVFIGIFPASHIYIRDEVADAEGRLATSLSQANGSGSSETSSNWARHTMDPLKEEDEDFDRYSTTASRKSFRIHPAPDQASISRGGLPVYSTSIRSTSPEGSSLMKPLPPRPSLKSGDDTASGQTQPIIDEIASALREWHSLMFQYLARRDYKLFHLVREHIEALHLGRRQLLAQTLNAEETINMRRECVIRLVSGNLVQGLDVIVRHPTGGGLVAVGLDGEADGRSWVSAVRMYAMQCSLGYLHMSQESTNLSAGRLLSASSIDNVTSGPQPTPAHSVFSDIAQAQKSGVKSLNSTGISTKPAPAKFFHVSVELRAFYASLCSPGETAELFFSLYRKQGTQFVTEDFCAILNHNGVLSQNPSSRIATIFTDLAVSDVQDTVYLVCKIIRNGALKIGNTIGSGVPLSDGKRSENNSRSDSRPQSGWMDMASPISPSPNDTNAPHFRRPFGCAVLELPPFASINNEETEGSVAREANMAIYVPTNEISFSMLHQNIINGNNKEFEKTSRAEMLAVSVKIFRGDADTIVKENSSLLAGIPRTLRLSFPDVVFPGDIRNELYVKLWSGEYGVNGGNNGRLSVSNLTRGQGGSLPSNVQVTVEVKDSDGTTIPNVISQGSGEPLMTQFHSIVFPRCAEPTYGELIKVMLPLTGSVPAWHLFFTFRNRSTRERSVKGGQDTADRPFAFAFLPLFPDKRAFIEDGGHTLVLFKAEKMGNILTETYLANPSTLGPNQRPESVSVNSDMQRLAPPLRDTLTIRSSLCSTRFTHNTVLLSLLHWENIADKELLCTVLTKFAFVGEHEIVKFLRDIFDSLFGIMVSAQNSSGEMDGLVFNALVIVLGITQDRRFTNFQPVLDVYIDNHFSCASASGHIMKSMNRLLSDPAGRDVAIPLHAALKVWHYIAKFIVRSRELQRIREAGMGSGTTAEHLEDTFRRELLHHISEVTKMMSTTSPPSINVTQTIALQHFTSVLPELAKVFPTVDLVRIVTTFATNAVTMGKGRIVIWKLVMYLQVVKGFLFDNAESRSILVQAAVQWIKPYFGKYNEFSSGQGDSETAKDQARLHWLEGIRLCVTIIAVMLDKLQDALADPTIISNKAAFRREQDNVEELLPLIPRLLESYRELENPHSVQVMEKSKSSLIFKSAAPTTFPESYPFSMISVLPETYSGIKHSSRGGGTYIPALGETATVLLVIILSSPNKHILNFLESNLEIEGYDRLRSLFLQFFKVAVSILDGRAFPKMWLNINILAHKVLVKMMEPVSTLLETAFIPPTSTEESQPFDQEVWKEAFYMLLKLLSSEQLVIEEFSPQKRRAVWRLAGDVRGEGAAILLNLWQGLGGSENPSLNGEPAVRFGGFQVHLNSLVGQVVHLCLSHHEQLRSNAVIMLYSMIISDVEVFGHFDEIEHELVTRLDALFMSESKGDDISGSFFVGQLRHLFESTDVNEQLRLRVTSFLDSVELFLELLKSVRALPEGEEFADERVIATLRLMNFIRRIGRTEIYVKYVHQLVNMHLQSQNYVEAALTLKLHADLHQWDLNTFVDPMEALGLPQQSEFHRKETLCLLILDYLGKGKAWENAIEICKELAEQHAQVTFNYARLAEIIRHHATLLEHIVNDQRYYPDYYLVTFYGEFPAALRDKKFIYRGYEWEKYAAFCERMLSKHQGAYLLKTSADPPVDIRFGTDKYIQCVTVAPEPDKTSAIFTSPDVPEPIKAYYEHSSLNLFSSSRQSKKISEDGYEESWLEKTYYTTEEIFPTVLRRSQVVALEVVEISPLESALAEVEVKTKELAALCLRYESMARTAQQVSTHALAMSLNSAVDTPLNTGIPLYRQMFFSPDYLARNHDQAKLTDKLRLAIDDQARVIDSCLCVHAILCPPEFVPFHETLERFFKKAFQEEISRLQLEPFGYISSNASLRDVQGKPNQTSQYERSTMKGSMSSESTARRKPFTIPALNLGRKMMTPPSQSPPQSPTSPTASASVLQPQPDSILQRSLAHLARHGFNGVSSSPVDMPGIDSGSLGGSPRNSFVNVGNTVHGISAAQHSMGSVANASQMGSMSSFTGSIKGRLSRFGSLNFGRKGVPHS